MSKTQAGIREMHIHAIFARMNRSEKRPHRDANVEGSLAAPGDVGRESDTGAAGMTASCITPLFLAMKRIVITHAATHKATHPPSIHQGRPK